MTRGVRRPRPQLRPIHRPRRLKVMTGGRARRRSTRKNPQTTPRPISTSSSSARRPVPAAAGGAPGKSRVLRNPFSYRYPDADDGAASDPSPSSPFLLARSSTAPVLAFISSDPSPSAPPTYEYDPMIVDAAVGLGFHTSEPDPDDAAAPESDPEAEVAAEREGSAGLGEASPAPLLEFATPSPPERKVKEKGSAYISIGGVRIYTEDTSSPDEGFEDDSDSESSCSDEDGSGSESGSSDAEEDDSDIDDEVAADYMEGVVGEDKMMSVRWLAGASLDAYDEDGFEKSGSDGVVEKLAGMELMSASEAYGMKKPRWKKAKGDWKPRKVGSAEMDVGRSLGWDDLLFKDSRRVARKKKVASSQLSRSWPGEGSRSWPGEGSRSKKYSGVPGEKKKHRKELIATKRHERAINRGVDFDEINLKLRQMVIDEADMLSFQAMHSRDCSQVRRLASVYHLQSGCQGSGKKRFVTVTRTGQTGLPSPNDKLRLDKLLGVGVVDGFVAERKLQKRANGKTKSGNSLHSGAASAPSKLTKGMESNRQKERSGRQSRYAEQPVSFVSCGVMQTDLDAVTETTIIESNVVNCEKVSDSSLGAFEKHTKGFGSKMMTRMGFIEGSGLGKDGQGMVRPIEAIQRPKSLGLGVQFTETPKDESVNSGRSSSKLASFEKHTKGFGSKRRMTKMGFVEGGGLGKEGQGMVCSIEATRRPKTRGLGIQFTEKNVRDESGSIGAFERHTKGFGSKVMEKMGFIPGTGLGRDAQGIVSPLTAVRRRRSQGLGA